MAGDTVNIAGDIPVTKPSQRLLPPTSGVPMAQKQEQEAWPGEPTTSPVALLDVPAVSQHLPEPGTDPQ